MKKSNLSESIRVKHNLTPIQKSKNFDQVKHIIFALRFLFEEVYSNILSLLSHHFLFLSVPLR